jgi:hypothetical protein
MTTTGRVVTVDSGGLPLRQVLGLSNQEGKVGALEADIRGRDAGVLDVRGYVLVMRKRCGQMGILWVRKIVVPA